MTGVEAFKALMDGKNVRCVGWPDPGYIYVIKDATFGHYKLMVKYEKEQTTVDEIAALPQEVEYTMDDLLNEKWEVNP